MPHVGYFYDTYITHVLLSDAAISGGVKKIQLGQKQIIWCSN